MLGGIKTKVDQILKGDCIEQMRSLPKGSVDAVFADPPYTCNYRENFYVPTIRWLMG